MSRKHPSLCHTPRCTKAHEPNRSTCAMCRKRAYRKAHAMRDAFQNLKGSAGKRDIFFGLSFEEFSELCYETEYLAGKGRYSYSYTVDRVIEGKLPGYVKWNIRVITRSANSSKEMTRRKMTLDYDWFGRTAKVIKMEHRPEQVEMLF